MTAPTRQTDSIYIMTPFASDSRETVRAAQIACRVAFEQGLRPRSPLLYYMTFLSVGEVSQRQRELFRQWFDRCPKIWLYFPTSLYEDQRLDSCSYELLQHNERAGKRRPVFLLEPHLEEHIPLPFSRQDVGELLLTNISLCTGRSTAEVAA